MSASADGPEICILRTGVANLASVVAGFDRIGARPRVTADPKDVEGAEYVVLPGVGSFGVAMQELRSKGLESVLRQRIAVDRATLCVCLGLQLLGNSSEESPGVVGVGVFEEGAARFPDSVRVPQLGWNKIEAGPDCTMLEDGYVYFANSFRLTEIPAGWRAACADHGGRFIAAIERGRILGCQFHPELSGPFGLKLLQRWLKRGADAEAQPC